MEKIWTSLVKVSGTKNSLILHGHADAFVWVAAAAPNVDEYKQSVEGAFQELELVVLSFEEIRTAEEVEAAEDDSDELQALISTIRNRQRPIAYGRFYRFTDGYV